VILQAVYREPPRLAEQCHAIGYDPLFFGPSPIVVDKTIELGGKHVDGMMGVEVYPLPTEPGAFLDLYRADMKKYFPNLELDSAPGATSPATPSSMGSSPSRTGTQAGASSTATGATRAA